MKTIMSLVMMFSLAAMAVTPDCCPQGGDDDTLPCKRCHVDNCCPPGYCWEPDPEAPPTCIPQP